ncbi:hypothetical protein HMI54_008854 [Coelomomyces lativittatus]|nr:hypothetical protein HMI54_008854 [Coelomomyces lativittatus]
MEELTSTSLSITSLDPSSTNSNLIFKKKENLDTSSSLSSSLSPLSGLTKNFVELKKISKRYTRKYRSHNQDVLEESSITSDVELSCPPDSDHAHTLASSSSSSLPSSPSNPSLQPVHTEKNTESLSTTRNLFKDLQEIPLTLGSQKKLVATLPLD